MSHEHPFGFDDFDETSFAVMFGADQHAEERFKQEVSQKNGIVSRIGHTAMHTVERALQIQLPRKALVIGSLSLMSVAGAYGFMHFKDAQPSEPTAPTERQLDPACYSQKMAEYAPEDVSVALKVETAESCMQTVFAEQLSVLDTTPDH